MTKAGQRLLKSVRQARAYARGETDEGFVVHVPNDVDVKAVRHKLDMTQQQFAARFGFSYDAIRDWESKRRQPERAARILLTVIDYEPTVVVKALQMHPAGGTVTAHTSVKVARAQKPKASKAAKRAFAPA